MILLQLPDPSLAQDPTIGVIGYLLIVLVLGLMGIGTWFLKRTAESMDRIAKAQEEGLPLLGAIDAKLDTMSERLSEKIDRSIVVGEMDLRIAEKWDSIEGREREERLRKQ